MVVIPYLLARELVTRTDRGRVPEPMVMDDPGSVAAFHEAGGLNGPNVPMYEICARAMSRLLPEGGTVLDLGSGSGRYLAFLARHRPDVRIVGLDLSDTMIATGRRFLAEEELDDRVTLLEADVTAFAADIAGPVDIVSAIWTLHQLPDVLHLDACLASIAAAREHHGCAVFLADFARLRHPRSFPSMVSTAREVPDRLRADGIASERAAWSMTELTAALERSGLGDLQHALASPLPLLQMHWAPPRGASNLRDEQLWQDLELPRGIRPDIAFWGRSFRKVFQGER